MQWSADRNAGFSRANPQRLYLPITLDPEYHYEAVNVEGAAPQPALPAVVDAASAGPSQRLARVGRGRLELLVPQNRKILAYVLRHERETLLVWPIFRASPAGRT